MPQTAATALEGPQHITSRMSFDVGDQDQGPACIQAACTKTRAPAGIEHVWSDLTAEEPLTDNHLLKDRASLQQHLEDIKTQMQDLESLYTQAVEHVRSDVTAHDDAIEAAAAQLRKALDNRLKAKMQELSQLKQQQLVTNAIKSLEQLQLDFSVRKLAAQSGCRSNRSSAGGTATGHNLHSQPSIGSSSSEQSTVSEAVLSDDSLDESSTCSSAAAVQPQTATAVNSQQQSSQLSSSEGTAAERSADPLQEAAVAAAVAVAQALAGIGSTQSSKSRNSNGLKEGSGPSSSWRGSSRQFTAAVANTPGAAPASIKAPASVDEQLADSPRSTSTATSSRSTSSIATSSKSTSSAPVSSNRGGTGGVGRTRSAADLSSRANRAAAAAARSAAPPPGFGPGVSTRVGPTAQQPPAKPVQQPYRTVAVPVAAGTPPGFASDSADDVPPGFGGMKRVGSNGQIQQLSGPPTAAQPPPAARPSARSHAQARRPGQSRLFQGALAGAMAERTL